MNSRVITRDYLLVADRESAQLRYPASFDSDGLLSDALQNVLQEKEKLWERRFEHIRNSSLKEGYQAGLEEGKVKAGEEFQEMAGRLQNILEEIDTKIEGYFTNLEPAIAELVFKLAGKVLQVPVENRELKQLVTDDIQQALRELTNKTEVVVSVSALDYETVEPLLRRSIPKGYIEISLHDDLKPGEYCIETPNEIIEKNFNRILNRLNKSYQVTKSEKQINRNSSADEHIEISD